MGVQPKPIEMFSLVAVLLCAAATLHVMDLPAVHAMDPRLNRSGWTATANTAQCTACPGRVLDGSTASVWTQARGGAPHPHEITIDLGASKSISGLAYLPRQTSDVGIVGRYEVRVSGDGNNFPSQPTAAGTWAFNRNEKTVTFPAVTGKAVRFSVIDNAGGRDERTAVAELNLFGRDVVTGGPSAPLPRAGFTATATTQQCGGQCASNVLDGNPASIWAQARTGAPPHPHSITITMPAPQEVSGMTVLPRQSGNSGIIGDYEIRVSTDGTSFPSQPLASGTWANDRSLKTVTWAPRTVRAVRLTSTDEGKGRDDKTSAAEINLLGPVGVPSALFAADLVYM